MKKIAKDSISIATLLSHTLVYAENLEKIEVKCEKVSASEFYEETSIIGICKSEKNSEFIAETSGKITYLTKKEGGKICCDEIIVKIDEDIAEDMIREANLKYEHENFKFLSARKLFEDQLLSYKEYKTAEIEFESAKISYEKNIKKYNSMIIKAPFDGKLGIFKQKVGNIIKDGDKLFDFVADEDFIIVAEISDTILEHLSDHTIEIFTFDKSNKKISCKLHAFSPNVSQNGTITLKIGMTKNSTFANGQFIELYILYNKHQAPSISEKAIIKTDKEEFIYEAVNGVCKKIIVKTGLRTEKKVELVNFDNKRDRFIIIEGLTKVSDGDSVSYESKTSKI